MLERDWLVVGKISAPMPYAYRGYMQDHIKTAMRMRAEGKTLTEVATYLYDDCGVRTPHARGYWSEYGDFGRHHTIKSMICGIRAVERRAGIQLPLCHPDHWPNKEYRKARREHAAFLRSQGETFKRIGLRLGVGLNRARNLVGRRT